MIAAFVVGLLPTLFKEATQTSIWAIRVNGQDVGYPEFMMEQERKREWMMNMRAQYGEYADWILSMMGANDPKVLAARSLIRQELVNQFADEVGIYMSPDAIAQKMSNPEFIQKELSDIIPPQVVDPVTGINAEMLHRYIKHFKLTPDLFERQIERALLDQLIMEFVESTLYVPQFDVKQKYQADFAKKSFSLFSISLAELLKKEMETAVSDEQLAAFYDEQNNNARRYWVPEKRTGTQWTFNPKSYRIVVTPEEVNEYYETNKIKRFIDKPSTVQVRRIVIAVPDMAQFAQMRTKAARIKDEIMNNPTQFEAIAKRESDDAQTAQKGGLMEPFSRGTHEISFDRAAFILPEDGAVSDVIETKEGLEILQRVSKTAPSYKPLSAVRSDIEQSLKQQKFSKQFMADMRKVADSEESLAAFIAQKGGIPKKLDRVSEQESSHLFKLQKGKKTFFVDGSDGVAIRLDDIQKSYLPSLETIKKTVTEDYYENKAQQKLGDALKQAKMQLKDGPLAGLKKEFNGDLAQTGWIDPSDKEAVEKIKAKGLPIEGMLQMEKVASVLTHQSDDRGFVVRLDEIEPVDMQKFEEKRDETARALKEQRMQQYREGFVASLHRNAKIETNESVITLQA